MIKTNAPYVAASDTSKARAQREDAAGITQDRREHVLALLAEAGTTGATWKEISDITGLHHGQVSSVLTRLHENGLAFQLVITRNGCHPYLIAAYRDDFYDYERNDEPVKTKANARVAALEAVAEAAYALCYSQASGSAAKWDALRVALAKVELPNV
jgi:hypothetical protein